jgi:putative RNA 2'-phosphotransferase
MTRTSGDLKALSKLISLILRHEPERFGVVLDPEGYTSIEDLLVAVRSVRPATPLEDIAAVVATVEPDKQRFTIIGDSIRANYGHSLRERVAQVEAAPPPVLYHGTSARAVEAILEHGLRPMNRQYVHLTTDRELARRVGGRRGSPVLLRVDAARASAEGVKFYKANVTFWLVDALPPAYLATEPPPSG